MIELLAVGAVAAGLLLSLGWAAIQDEARTHRERKRIWGEALDGAALEHLTDEGGGPSGTVAFEGLAAGRFVRVEEYSRSKQDGGVSIRVAGSSEVSLRGEWFGTALKKALGTREIELGDDAFDKEVLIEGPRDLIRAVLDAETRPVVLAFLKGRFDAAGVEAWTSVRKGDVVAEFRSSVESGLIDNFASILRALLDVARRLDRPADLVGRIVENTRREPEWRVRLGNLLLLSEDYRGQPAVRDAFRRACQDPHPELRLRAGLALGEEGRGTLLKIASSGSNEPQAARAVAGLGEHLPLETGLDILGTALRARHVETARACLEALGRVGGSSVVHALAKVLAVEKGDLAMAAAQALGASGAAEAEAPLLQALARDSAEVGAAAAESLGHVGSASAVLPLKEAASRERADDRFRRAAREAVARIQSRLEDASPGQLSLADGEAGQLSLAGEDPAGRVSLPDHGAGAPIRGSER